MKKSANYGTLYPRARVGLNNSSGTRLCAAVGTTALTTALTKYTLTCQTTAAIAMKASDRFYLWTGVNLTAGNSANSFTAQLSIEGTAGGNYDSLVVIPKPTPTALPSVSITAPANNTSVAAGSTVTINATAADSDGRIAKVEFYRGATKLGEDTSAPYSYTWTNAAAGSYQLTATATDNLGAKRTSSAVNLSVTSPPNTASFVEADNTTLGNWKTKYGGDGYHVIGDAQSYPAYAQVTVAGQSNHIWAASTSETRAVLKAAPNSTDRIAACWYSTPGFTLGTNFTVNVNLTDGQIHRLALYMMDMDNVRQQTIEILDASTNQVLNTQSVTNFSSGRYLVWDVKGNLRVRVTNAAVTSNNAVISGLFFGNSGVPQPPVPQGPRAGKEYIYSNGKLIAIEEPGP